MALDKSVTAAPASSPAGPSISAAQATWLLEVLNHPNLAIQISDTGKLRLAADVRETLAAIAGTK